MEQLKDKKATAADALDGFAAAETALREAAKQSQAQESRRGPRTAEDIPDEVAAAGRQVTAGRSCVITGVVHGCNAEVSKSWPGYLRGLVSVRRGL